MHDARAAIHAEFPVTLEIPVAWAEMDAFGHVNNTVYFRWFESARIAFLDAIAFRGGAAGSGIGPILHSTHCRFRRALAYPDRVTVGARVTGVEPDRFAMEYRVASHGLNAVAAEGGGIVVAYDYGAMRKAAIPDAVRERIRTLQRQQPG